MLFAAMAMMVMPGSAYFNIWYVDNPADTLDDGLSNVQWLGPVMDSGSGYGYDIPSGMDYIGNAYWYGFSRYRNDNYQNSWWYANYVPDTWPNPARHNVEGYPRQTYVAEFYNYNCYEGDDVGVW